MAEQLVFPKALYYENGFFLRFVASDYNVNLSRIKETLLNEDKAKNIQTQANNGKNDKTKITDLANVRKQADKFNDLLTPEQTKEEKFQCYLPLNKSIQESLDLKWQKVENIMSGNYTSEMQRILKVETLQNIVGGIVGAFGSMGKIAKRLTSTENISVATKRYIYPNYGFMFQGVGHRNFSFDYTLIPSNKEEADNIIKIVNNFKYYSLPDEQGNFAGIETILKYPAIWNIELFMRNRTTKEFNGEIVNTSNIINLIKFSDLVLTGITINYGKQGEGQFYFYKDGMPNEIGLTLNFTEMKFLTRKSCGIEPENNINNVTTNAQSTGDINAERKQ